MTLYSTAELLWGGHQHRLQACVNTTLDVGRASECFPNETDHITLHGIITALQSSASNEDTRQWAIVVNNWTRFVL
jgi:hypothetical protein